MVVVGVWAEAETETKAGEGAHWLPSTIPVPVENEDEDEGQAQVQGLECPPCLPWVRCWEQRGSVSLGCDDRLHLTALCILLTSPIRAPRVSELDRDLGLTDSSSSFHHLSTVSLWS